LIGRNLSEQSYSKFCQFLEKETGIKLGDSKQYLVKSRLVGILHDYQYNGVDELIDAILKRTDRQLLQRSIDAMTTNETLWFRDNYPFTLLTDQILPQISQLNPNLRRPLRIWSAACSTGQEAYSIAMTLLEAKGKLSEVLSRGFEIVATDLSQSVLEIGQKGVYDNISIGRGLPEQMQRKYFSKVPVDSLEITSEVKKHVRFQKLNLLDSYRSLGRFDIVFCRNVLIYFSPQNKQKILQQIAASLEANGSLLLGASESVSSVADLFTMHKANQGLYYVKRSL
jgi:chemotaxis protein methyltransferase CheR